MGKGMEGAGVKEATGEDQQQGPMHMLQLRRTQEWLLALELSLLKVEGGGGGSRGTKIEYRGCSWGWWRSKGIRTLDNGGEGNEDMRMGRMQPQLQPRKGGQALPPFLAGAGAGELRHKKASDGEGDEKNREQHET
eukprot:1146372-Pelagomonas_calceolata.AAC.2